MAIDTDIFAEDFLVAQDDMSTPADFADFTVDVIFQKVSQAESPLMEGVEEETSAVCYVSLDELGSNDINVGDKVTIQSNEYRVLSTNPYTHGQFFRLDLTDENS